MSNDEWLKKIQEIKSKEKEIEDNLEADKKAWADLREKHKEDAPRIIKLLNSELKKAVDVFDNASLREFDRPKVESSEHGVSLRMPIVHSGTHIGLSIGFYLHLTKNGYGLAVTKSLYDHVQDRRFESKSFIQPPADANKIQTEVSDFLRERNFAVERLAEKEKRFRKELG